MSENSKTLNLLSRKDCVFIGAIPGYADFFRRVINLDKSNKLGNTSNLELSTALSGLADVYPIINKLKSDNQDMYLFAPKGEKKKNESIKKWLEDSWIKFDSNIHNQGELIWGNLYDKPIVTIKPIDIKQAIKMLFSFKDIGYVARMDKTRIAEDLKVVLKDTKEHPFFGYDVDVIEKILKIVDRQNVKPSSEVKGSLIQTMNSQDKIKSS